MLSRFTRLVSARHFRGVAPSLLARRTFSTDNSKNNLYQGFSEDTVSSIASNPAAQSSMKRMAKGMPLTREDFPNALPNADALANQERLLALTPEEVANFQAPESFGDHETGESMLDTQLEGNAPDQIAIDVQDRTQNTYKRITAPFGTVEEPVQVYSPANFRIVGCVGGNGMDHETTFFVLEGDKKHMCVNCGQIYQLQVDPAYATFNARGQDGILNPNATHTEKQHGAAH